MQWVKLHNVVDSISYIVALLLMWQLAADSFNIQLEDSSSMASFARIEILWESGTRGKDADAISSCDIVKFCAIELVIFTHRYQLTVLVVGMLH